MANLCPCDSCESCDSCEGCNSCQDCNNCNATCDTSQALCKISSQTLSDYVGNFSWSACVSSG